MSARPIDALLAQAERRARKRRRSATCRPTTTRCRPCSTSPPSACGRAWGAVSHLNAVADTPELRAAYNENLPKVTEFHTRLGADERLYAKYKAIAASAGGRSADARRAARRWPTRCATSCCRAPSCRATRRSASPQIQERMAELAQKFSEHVLDATDGFAYYASEPTSWPACRTT